MSVSLTRAIFKNALFHPRRTAVVDDMGSVSYFRLAAGAMHLARIIQKTTDARHVGIMLPTSSAFPMALLGTWLSKRVAVSLNYLLAPDELRYVIEDSGIDTIFTASKLLDATGAGDAIPEHINVVHLDRMEIKGLPPLILPRSHDADDLAVLLYTSGTSGRPKGVMLSHGNLYANVTGCIKHVNLTIRDSFLGVLPQFHSFGLTVLTILPLLMGSKAIYSARFIPKKIVELIRTHRPGIMVGIPSMYGALLSVKSLSADDLASLRIIVSGGEPLPNALHDAFLERFDRRILEGYGLTETSPVANWSTPDRFRPFSVGQPLPGVGNVILDSDDTPIGPNEDGEIIITGPNIMLGYYNQPELTEQVIMELPEDTPGATTTRGFRTGDIGRVDDEGYLYITGRKKEMMIIGGENVFPREIEQVIQQHPAVKAVAVVGKPDAMRGEQPIAFVELEDDADRDAGNEAAIRKLCRDNLAGYKVPREVRFVDALPRNPTGKILRRSLADELKGS